MRILVTGGAGFIGSNLVDYLMAQGHEITVIDNLSVGKVSNIEHHLGSERFHFVNDSILNLGTLERLVRQVELIYHLAAVVGVKYVVDDPLGAIVTNVRGTENVLEMAFKYWVRTVIASSSEIYGKSTQVPLREDSDRVLGPTTVGRWSYSDAKAIDEYFALAYARKGLPVSVVRYFNAYGPRLDPKGYGSVIARFITQALQGQPLTVYDDGRQTRCFTYVADTVEGTVRAATLREAAGQVFNIGSDRETSILELARLVRELTGSSSEIVHVPYEQAYGPAFEETRRRVPDVTRAREVLGFEARTTLEEGLRRTVEWFQVTVTSKSTVT
ncbi:MAG: GDP-mannose 4,6-dehydratase [Anaerolineae bacterium]|nr:GDP-mannose 4,6-dehydratase [Anaerolineae bacterium]